MIYLFVGAVCLAIGLFILRPLLGSPAPQTASQTAVAPADSQPHEAVAELLQELEFDHSIGKIDDADFAARRAEIENRSAQVLHIQASGIQGSSDIQGSGTRNILDGAMLSSAREAELELEVLVMRARRETTRQGTDWHCNHCNRRMNEADRFCASCGAPRQAAIT